MMRRAMMTLEEAMAKSAMSIDTQIAGEIERNEIMLADNGSNEDEIAEFIATRKEELGRWKAETLAEIRRGLSDFDAPTGKVQ
jgi:hypothetical protein